MLRAQSPILNSFLSWCNSEKRNSLIKHLPHNLQEELKKLPPSFKDPKSGITSQKGWLEKIDPSWLAPYLRTLPEGDIRLFLASLSEAQRKELKKNLLFSNHLPVLTDYASAFLRQWLFDKLLEKEERVLPAECLPASPLNALLDLEKGDLMRLVFFLGVHDLSIELRHIIETSKLKQIYAALNIEQQRYLTSLLQHREQIAFKRMGLDRWDGNEEALKTMIYTRGLNRLAKALYGQEKSLIWYLSHTLETTDASFLKKFGTDLQNPQAIALLGRQVLDLLNLFNKKSEART